MIDGLSKEGKALKDLCDSMASSVAGAVRSMVGDPASGTIVDMGADGTPTKSIDRVAENAVLETLRASGEGFTVLSEEIGEIQIGEHPGYLIHLDPLDGTYNAIKGIPFYSLSIYLSQGERKFGYVFDLAKGTKYYAEEERGAYADPGGRLGVSKTSVLKDFSISAYTVRPYTSRIVVTGDTVRRIRTLGSTSLELSMVAAGKLDAFLDLREMLRAVDVAAGKLILEEAGGLVTDAYGRKILLKGGMWQRTEMIGSNGILHSDLLKLVGGRGA